MILALWACAPKPAPAPTPVAEPAPAVVDPLAVRPTIGPPKAFVPPRPTEAKLTNGARVWLVPDTKLPLVSIVVEVPGGSALDPKGKEGTAALSDRLLRQGAGKLDAAAFAETVERLGIDLSVDTGRARSTIQMTLRKGALDQGLDLLADMVLRPTYTKADFARERELVQGDIQVSLDEVTVIASRVGQHLWFGPAHPYAHPAVGTEKGLDAVTVKDVAAYHARAWNAAGATFVVSGDVDSTVVQKLDQRFAGWKATTPAVTPVSAPAPRAGTGWVLVDKPGSAQTMFYLMFPGVSAKDPTLEAVRAGTIVLGGTFTSRLNGLLREKRGYTYGARASVAPMESLGFLTIGTRIRADVTAPALQDLVGELKSIQAGISAEELVKAQGAYRQDQVEAMGTRAGIAATFAEPLALGLPPTALADALGRMGAVTPDAVKPAMASYDLSKALVVLVGDRATIEKPLVDAGFGPFVIQSEL